MSLNETIANATSTPSNTPQVTDTIGTVTNASFLTEAFENQYVPAYYVFDREGKLRHFQAGGSGMKMLEKRVNRVLDELEKTE